MRASLSDPFAPEPDLHRVSDALQDALLELDVWRQHARTPAEWTALRRMALALGAARQEVIDRVEGPMAFVDTAQHTLPLE